MIISVCIQANRICVASHVYTPSWNFRHVCGGIFRGELVPGAIVSGGFISPARGGSIIFHCGLWSSIIFRRWSRCGPCRLWRRRLHWRLRRFFHWWYHHGCMFAVLVCILEDLPPRIVYTPSDEGVLWRDANHLNKRLNTHTRTSRVKYFVYAH